MASESHQTNISNYHWHGWKKCTFQGWLITKWSFSVDDLYSDAKGIIPLPSDQNIGVGSRLYGHSQSRSQEVKPRKLSNFCVL